MKNLIILIEQISNSVLPYTYTNIINSGCLRLFRFIACSSVITLFMFKNSLSSPFIYLLLLISYMYIIYQCMVIGIKIYYVHRRIMTTKAVCVNIPLSHIKILYNIIMLLVVLIGLPMINDTLLEIAGDIKHILKQILDKRKK